MGAVLQRYYAVYVSVSVLYYYFFAAISGPITYFETTRWADVGHTRLVCVLWGRRQRKCQRPSIGYDSLFDTIHRESEH